MFVAYDLGQVEGRLSFRGSNLHTSGRSFNGRSIVGELLGWRGGTTREDAVSLQTWTEAYLWNDSSLKRVLGDILYILIVLNE